MWKIDNEKFFFFCWNQKFHQFGINDQWMLSAPQKIMPPSVKRKRTYREWKINNWIIARAAINFTHQIVKSIEFINRFLFQLCKIWIFFLIFWKSLQQVNKIVESYLINEQNENNKLRKEKQMFEKKQMSTQKFG